MRRIATALRRIPRPLALLLPVILVTTTIWTFFDPVFAVPDEPQHFAYTESLVERHSKPNHGTALELEKFLSEQDAFSRKGELSSQAQQVLDTFNTYPNVYDLYSRPPWGESAEDRYNAAADNGSRDDGGRSSSASSYPPLYYAVESIPYVASSWSSSLNQVYAMRWFSGLWAIVTAIGAWLLAGEVFGRRRLPQLACAATLGLWPMISFLSAAVNPDGMLTALSVLSLWLAVRIARRGTELWPSVALLGLVAAATLTKVSGVALAPAAVFAIIIGLPRVRALTQDKVVRLLGLGAGMLVAAGLVLLVANAADVLPPQLQSVTDTRPDLKHFASYLWQFYLPNPGFLDGKTFLFPVISDLPLYNTWLGTSWGTFGWVEIWFPTWAYKFFFVLSLAVVVGAIVTAVKALRGRRAHRTEGSAGAAIVLAIAAVGILAGVHLQDFDNLVNGRLPFAQGRYLFPVAGLGGLAVAAAVEAVPTRWRPSATAGWLGFLLVFQLAALSIVALRFYA